jgi:hypothetical protein
MRWHPWLPAVHSMMIADNGAEPGGNSGDSHRGENATTKRSPSRGRAKLSSIMMGIIIVAVTLLWATFLFWLATRMIVWIAAAII